MPVTIMKKTPKPAPLPVKKMQSTAKADPLELTPGATEELIIPQATVTKDYSDGSSVEEKELVGLPLKIIGPHATVGVNMAITRNLGNYENVKLGVSFFMPTGMAEEQIDATYNFVKEWVDMRVNALSDEINQQLNQA